MAVRSRKRFRFRKAMYQKAMDAESLLRYQQQSTLR